MFYTRRMYAIVMDVMEAVGCRGAFRGLAGAAVPAGRTDAALAQRLCVVRAWFRCFGRCSRFAQPAERHPLRRAFFIAYLCGFLWYMGNCYWIRDTMSHYGDMPPLAPTLLLIGFSLVLGLYFGLFGLGLVLVRRATGSTRLALAFAPFLWTGLELAAARITSVPWDQLGYSQVDNALINQLAPWTGVYGISFVLVAVNALLAGGLLLGREIKNPLSGRWAWTGCGALLLISGFAGVFVAPPKPAPTATAVLIQPNLDVGSANNWQGPEWDRHIAEFTRLAGEQCKTYIAGIPQTGAPTGEIICPPYPTHPDLVAWPESPAPFDESDPRFKAALVTSPAPSHAPLVVGGIGWTFDASAHEWNYYNSALVVDADGKRVGRYDKIHLVPFGEYIPFQNLLTFAHKLTGRVRPVHARQRAQRFSAAYAERRKPSLRRLHLLRGGLRRRGAPVCAPRR